MEQGKTMLEHLESGAKYSGSSVTVGTAIAVLIGYFVPGIKEDITVFGAVQGLCIFLMNGIFVTWWKQ